MTAVSGVTDSLVVSMLHRSAGQMSSGPISIDSISRQISCPPGEAFITDIALNSTGSVLYSAAGNTVKIWDLNT